MSETKADRLARLREQCRLGREHTYKIVGEILCNAVLEMDRDDLPKLLAVSAQLTDDATKRAMSEFEEFDLATPEVTETGALLAAKMNRAAVALADSINPHDMIASKALHAEYHAAKQALAAMKKKP